jgi:hypothetical protein
MVVAQPELTGCECLCFRKLISKKARKLRAFFLSALQDKLL